MKNRQVTTLFQSAPAFSTEATAEARWDKIAWKLDAFRQQGGSFRTQTIEAFETSRNHAPEMGDNCNNCFASAIGFLVTGNYYLKPGAIHCLQRDQQTGLLYGDKRDGLFPKYNINNSAHFEEMLQKGLQNDGIERDIQADAIDRYHVIIGLTYACDLDMGAHGHIFDYHFIVPVLGAEKGPEQPDLCFSSREGCSGRLEIYHDAESMMHRYLDQDCVAADVYCVPKEYLGQKACLVNSKKDKDLADRYRLHVT